MEPIKFLIDLYGLLEKPDRPSRISELKKQIEEAEQMVLARAVVNEFIDMEFLERIKSMKQELNTLYEDWVCGRIC